MFARLRQVRKEMAQAEAVPVYTVFTNEQLAQMVQARATTRAALEKIAGVGERGSRSTAPRILDSLRQWSGTEPVRMRRAGNLFERIIDRENLRLAVTRPCEASGPRAMRARLSRTWTRTSSDAPGPASRRFSGRRLPPVHDLRSQGTADHGAVFSRTGPAPRHHERLRADLRTLADRRHVRLPEGQGTDAAALQRAQSSRGGSPSSSSWTSESTSTASRTRS